MKIDLEELSKLSFDFLNNQPKVINDIPDIPMEYEVRMSVENLVTGKIKDMYFQLGNTRDVFEDGFKMSVYELYLDFMDALPRFLDEINSKHTYGI
jgi:hypothetical protein